MTTERQALRMFHSMADCDGFPVDYSWRYWNTLKHRQKKKKMNAHQLWATVLLDVYKLCISKTWETKVIFLQLDNVWQFKKKWSILIEHQQHQNNPEGGKRKKLEQVMELRDNYIPSVWCLYQAFYHWRTLDIKFSGLCEPLTSML